MNKDERLNLIRRICRSRQAEDGFAVTETKDEDVLDELSRLSHYTQSNPRERFCIDDDE